LNSKRNDQKLEFNNTPLIV